MNESVSPETREVSVTLGGVTRVIKISRHPGGVWYAVDAAVICRFRTGTKLHTRNCPQVYEHANGTYTISRVVVANREARATAWATAVAPTSQWRREARIVARGLADRDGLTTSERQTLLKVYEQRKQAAHIGSDVPDNLLPRDLRWKKLVKGFQAKLIAASAERGAL